MLIDISDNVPRLLALIATILQTLTRMPAEGAFLLSLVGWSTLILIIVTRILSAIRLMINDIPMAGTGGSDAVAAPATGLATPSVKK